MNQIGGFLVGLVASAVIACVVVGPFMSLIVAAGPR